MCVKEKQLKVVMFGFTIYEKLNVLHEVTAKCIFDGCCCLLLNDILIK